MLLPRFHILFEVYEKMRKSVNKEEVISDFDLERALLAVRRKDLSKTKTYASANIKQFMN